MYDHRKRKEKQGGGGGGYQITRGEDSNWGGGKECSIAPSKQSILHKSVWLCSTEQAAAQKREDEKEEEEEKQKFLDLFGRCRP